MRRCVIQTVHIAHLRHGEPRQQTLEEAAGAKLAQPAALHRRLACQLAPLTRVQQCSAHQLAFRCARRTNQQQVLTTDGSQQQQPNLRPPESENECHVGGATQACLRLALDEPFFDDAQRRDYLLPQSFDAAVTVARSWRGAGLRLRAYASAAVLFGSAKPPGRANSRVRATRALASVKAANRWAESAFTASISSSMRCSCESRPPEHHVSARSRSKRGVAGA